MTLKLVYEDPSQANGVMVRKFEKVKRPNIVPPGFMIVTGLDERELFSIPAQRIVSMEYEDNQVSLVNKIG